MKTAAQGVDGEPGEGQPQVEQDPAEGLLPDPPLMVADEADQAEDTRRARSGRPSTAKPTAVQVP